LLETPHPCGMNNEDEKQAELHIRKLP